MKRVVFGSLTALALSAAPLIGNAAGMGRITVLSALGQPLRAELDIAASREELASLTVRVAPIESFRQASVEYAPVLSAIRFTPDKRSDGKPYYRIQTDRPVNDPFIDFLVEMSWSSGRLVREYTFLLDPPELNSQSAGGGNAMAPVARMPATASAPAGQPIEAADGESGQAGRMQSPVESRKPKTAGEDATAKEVVANTRRVKPGDTLSKIAAESAIDGITFNQMLVALLNSNQDAFVGGNMNRLLAGKIIQIPDAEKAATVSAEEARKTVVVQYSAFNDYRKSLAEAAANQAPMEQQAQQSSSGKIAPRVEETLPPSSGKDKLQVSRSETQETTRGKLSEEDIIARDKALKEANARIAELEENLADLKQLAELKSQAATGAQSTGEPASAAPAAAASTASTVDDEKAAISAAAVVPAAEEKPQPKPKKKKAVPPPSPPETSLIEDNPMLIYGGGVAVALILGLLGFRVWKRKRDGGSDQDVTVSDLAANSVFGAAASEGIAADSVPQSDFDDAIPEAAVTEKEEVDPIQEAELYMAYGRDDQAEGILVDAMQKDPGNLAVYLKLLEIYEGRKSLPQFNEIASELHTRTEGHGSEWGKAAAMGRSLDPTNPLYGGTASEDSGLSHDQTVAIAAPVVGASMAETIVMDATPVFEAPAAGEAVPETAHEEPSSALDFDLDLGGGDEGTVAEEVQGGGLDINFDAPDEAGNTIDFDIDTPAAQEAAPAVREAAAPALKESNAAANEAEVESGLDFDFDLGESASEPAKQSLPDMDLSSISLDLDDPTAPASAEGTGDSSEVATKLELAQAYEEMGDREGTRELLQEVLAEGSAAQQEIARNKLAQLG